MLFKKKQTDKNTNIKKSKKGKIRENIEVIFSAIGIALLIRIFVIEAYSIPTGSMIPNLLQGDRLIVNKFIYGVRIPVLGWKLPALSYPKRGDMVVFQTPTYTSVGAFKQLLNLITFGVLGLDNTPQNPRIFVKRAIGIPGDIIELNTKDITEANTTSTKQYISINGSEYKTDFIKSSDEESSYRGNQTKIYYENNGSKKYKIQYFSSRSLLRGFFYIPRENDVVTLELLDRESGTRTDSSSTEENPSSLRFETGIFISGKVKMTINGRRTIEVSGEVFETIYNNIYNKIFPREVLVKLSKNNKASHVFKDNYYFMMGDNRDDSSDSRIWGLLKEDLIIGTPMVIYYPLKRVGLTN